MSIQSLLFDLDNTLVDRSAAHRAYWEEFLQRFPGAPGTKETQAVLDSLILQDEWGYRPRQDYFAWVSTALPAMQWPTEAFWSDYRSRIASFIKPDPLVNDALKVLTKTFSVAIVSNGSSAVQRRKLDQSQLSAFFQNVFISGECGVEKPAPEIFLTALRALDCEPSAALFIGDDPVRDIEGAARVGCQTCWICHGRQFPQGLPRPDFSLQSVVELLPQ